ncbi:MAG: SDR family oxidoreductase [Planctomycetaceae bacterium]
MKHLLLTGATGLLGNYLLRDLLRSGTPVAVLARSTRKMSARQRIDSLLSDWEKSQEQLLSRPVVLEGDISQPDLGLDGDGVRWVMEYCSGIIHNAASLQFHATSSAGEPWASNVAGTEHMLEFCRATRIRQLHHVSTAYVAGLRTGRVLESEVDVGQELSNDYEQSKLTAEKLVRAADFLDDLTVFRPGIIIGDSATGFTTTYHGYYAALQLVHTIVKTLPANETGRVGGNNTRLTLHGTETKHLVPVDWVAAVMGHVIRTPKWHGRTYHLVPRHPVTVRLIRDVLEQSAGFYGPVFTRTAVRPDDLNEIERLFYEHIRVYNSYWRMDPEFDCSNVLEAAPHLPCPHVDRQMLVKLSRVAIDSGFPTPSKRPPELDFDADEQMQPLLEQGRQSQWSDTNSQRLLGLDVRGPGGGQWQLVVRGPAILGAELGIHESASAVCRLNVDTFAALLQGQLSWSEALSTQAAEIQGNGRSTSEYGQLLEQLFSPALG